MSYPLRPPLFGESGPSWEDPFDFCEDADCPQNCPECCCDCFPETLEVVITGTGTAADGTWTLLHSAFLCRWVFNDEILEIVANWTTIPGSDPFEMNLSVTRISDSEVLFLGASDGLHYGACKHIVFDGTREIENDDGTGEATLEGECVPECDAEPCAIEFDPSSDSLPCQSACCPTCVPEAIQVTLQGITFCMGVCYNAGGSSVRNESLSVNSSFQLEFNGVAASPCEWGIGSGGGSAGMLQIGSFTRKIWFSDPACAGDPNQITNYILKAAAYYSGSNLVFDIRAETSPGGVGSTILSGSIPCGEWGAINFTQAGPCVFDKFAFGGSAIVAPCP